MKRISVSQPKKIVCPGECVRNVARISRVLIARGREIKGIKPVD
jgi:hypothetical protein